ncbi:MAG: ribbon-helix-helix domain-containing protein [archaeon]
MENICLRLDNSLSKQIEKDMKEFRYSTKTEFIREAIRTKLKELDGEREKKKAWKALFNARGIFKGKGKTDEEFYEWRKEYGKKLAGELEKKYGLKA